MTTELLTEQVRAMDYLRRKGTDAPVADLRRQLRSAFRDVEALLASVAPDERLLAPAAGKWSPQEILDHLVVSHGPAIEHFRQLLTGISPEAVAIPAGLQSAAPRSLSWDLLASNLAAIHGSFEKLVAAASESLPLEAKAIVEMVVKVPATEGAEPRPVHWYERLDWKQFVQVLRVHTLEHRAQLDRTLSVIRAG